MSYFQSLGNHELDEAVDGLTPFIKNLTSPVLAANLILDKIPELENEPNLHKSIILDIDGIKIGIIGYLTPETKFLAPKNDIEYEDEVIAIRREVEVLKNEGVTILIALGHSGFIKDLEIAKNVEDIDLVIGGHSNTFLWNGDFGIEKPEIPEGPYPVVVSQLSGKKVPVVQAFAYTKYLGSLHLTFDSDGEIVKYDGQPLLLDHRVPSDPDVQAIVDRYRKEITEINKMNSVVVGQSTVALNGDCRLVECNMGNLFTDAILNYTSKYYPEHKDVKIAVVQGGRIRSSLDQPEKPFNLTREDLLGVLPFSDTLSIVTMNSTQLLQALEHSISMWRTVDAKGQFLQMSGMKVTYDLAQPVGSRVVTARAVCSNCEEYKLVDINDNNVYKVFMPTFLANGGDNFTMFESLPKVMVSYDELISTVDYIVRFSPVTPEVSGRIIIVNKDKVINAESQITNKAKKLTSFSHLIAAVLVPIYFVINN